MRRTLTRRLNRLWVAGSDMLVDNIATHVTARDTVQVSLAVRNGGAKGGIETDELVLELDPGEVRKLVETLTDACNQVESRNHKTFERISDDG